MSQKNEGFGEIIENDIEQSAGRLKHLIAQADGIQRSKDSIGNARHLSNTLFNIMRGGIFAKAYQIEREDFIEFVKKRNQTVFNQHINYLKLLPEIFHVNELKVKLQGHDDAELLRYGYEYLPITFSRRHGDPSRPWNKFNIDVLKKDGSWEKRFEGNWRDIFQNWEALGYSYPEFAENMIAVFLNASTADGYNPYRITNNGIEWEITDPDDPWSFIGYWGDHQIIYLLKLLELSNAFHPGKLQEFVNKPFFTFGNVPYRIKEYAKIVNNPHNTISYDEKAEKLIAERISKIGIDGKLLCTESGAIARASLTEKLLIPLLTKLSNFVPEGGIWMNTQRPEWNDANNTLVGQGLSMVTVYYMYRYVRVIKDFYNQVSIGDFEINIEVKDFFISISKTLQGNLSLLKGPISDKSRKNITDLLGGVGESYRQKNYSNYSEKKSTINKTALLHFIDLCSQFLEHTIKANKRSDQLYHAYNLIEIKEIEFGVKHLYPMLEGQVAVLSSGLVKAKQAVEMLNALRKSEMYRDDQNSYVLYPDRSLSKFMDKAVVDDNLIKKSNLAKKLIAVNDSPILIKDNNGKYHFNPTLSNANEIKDALSALRGKGFDELIDQEQRLVLDAYEAVFNHHAFTGRSGTFFGYEGLGSIYWHMNSKLLLAIQEILQHAIQNHENGQDIDRLKKYYDEIKEGLGTHKSPERYGAFPTDPYSHTPAHKGAQQPGMTGQVKEDILSRIGELGVTVRNGCIHFSNSMLDPKEFLTHDSNFEYYGVNGTQDALPLKAGSMAFMFCQVPIIYVHSNTPAIIVFFNDGKSDLIDSNILSSEFSKKLFNRDGTIEYLKVGLVIDQ